MWIILGGTVGLVQNAGGLTTLAGANTYAGITAIHGTLKLGKANAIPGGSGKGDVIFFSNPDTATLDLAGFTAVRPRPLQWPAR